MPLSASLLYADEPKALSKESNEKQTEETLLNQNSEHTDDSGLLRTQENNNNTDNADDLAQSVSIVFTNDVNCKIDFDDNDRDSFGYAGVAPYRAAADNTYGEEYVTLIDAGDAVQGDVAGTISGRITEEAKEAEINPQPDASTDQTTIEESLNEPKEQSEESKPSKLAKTNDTSEIPLATLIVLAAISALALTLSANRCRQKAK